MSLPLWLKISFVVSIYFAGWIGLFVAFRKGDLRDYDVDGCIKVTAMWPLVLAVLILIAPFYAIYWMFHKIADYISEHG